MHGGSIGIYGRQCVRVVKESDSKSDGLCPRGFESLRCRFYLVVVGDCVLLAVRRFCAID